MTNQTLPPSILIEGPPTATASHAEHFVARTLCSQPTPSDDCFCTSCRQVKNNQHANALWLSPEREYTTKDIAVIFEKAHLALQPDEHFFFILTAAHLLTATTANRLLKLMEEPPEGFHFLLLTTNSRAVLPTIVSRCHVLRLRDEAEQPQHPLTSFFTSSTPGSNLMSFDAAVRDHAPSHIDALAIVHEALAHYEKQIHAAASDGKPCDALLAIHTHLTNVLKRPPQNGSGPLFLRSVYVGWQSLEVGKQGTK